MENQDSSVVEEGKWWGSKQLQQINGFWFIPRVVPAVQRVLAEFNPHPNDVILASFPKTGTTWLKSLLYSIIYPSCLDSLIKHNPHDLVPFLEMRVFNEGSPPYIMPPPNAKTNIFSTHIPYQLLGKTFESSGCRVVYVARNPKDTLNSLWHYVNKSKVAEEGAWGLEEAVEKFCQGIVPFGSYYDHVLGYKLASLKNPNKVFFITYEELKNDTKTHVKRLAEFLGCPFAEEDNNKVEEIVRSCSFEVLSNHEVNKSKDSRTVWTMAIATNALFRKAIVGDHKKYLNDESIKRIDALTKEKFHNSGIGYAV
ncbi:PREDICTED: cytosolic sulfotransferase 17-like [Ipomoea nil]|uniref:cytosolic sulfotransferase 17-like n=1 Tax=Ipomoea nil TaxID=35883 RepID=UPI000901FA8D|nr:PREDICTED: cytosolic sulfotransferase 17-like [Ipomoea nil]